MQPTTLQTAFDEAIRPNGLIAFVTKLREPDQKYKIKKDEVYALFKGCPLWKEQTTKSGHVAFKHQITGISVGYQNHGDPKLDPGGAIEMRDSVQKHLNALANNIFGYERNHWKYEPNWALSEKRYQNLGGEGS